MTLTESQQSKLAEFKSFSGLTNDEECIRILESYNWDYQAAANAILVGSMNTEQREFDDDADDDVKQGLLQDRSESRRRNNANQNQNASYCNRVWKSVSYGFRKIFYWFGLSNYDPAAHSDEKSTTSSERFVQSFEKKYGALHPQFFLGSFSLALSQAERSRKIVFLYIHSDEHDDTNTFVQTCLTKAEVVAFLDENCVSVAFSVKDYEGYKVSRYLKVESYPFSCVLAKIGNQLTVRARQDGLVSSDAFLANLIQAQQELNEISTASSTSNPAPAVSTADILRQQEEEYQEALARDRAKRVEEEQKRQKLQEEQKKRAEEEQKRLDMIREADLAKKKKEEERAAKLLAFPPEPENGKDVYTIQLRLPNGKTIRRRFNSSATFDLLANFVSCHELIDLEGHEIVNWEFVMNYPKKSFSNDSKQSLIEAGVPDQSVLFIREVF